MQFDRFGVVTFFGILIPGAYLATILILATACSFELRGIFGHAEIFSYLSANFLPSTTILLFFSYLLGVLVRLFSPNAVDRASTYYLRLRRGKRKPSATSWIEEKFPYKESIAKRCREDGMGEVLACIESINISYARPGNNTFFNYCKLFIEGNSVALSRHIRQAEAMIRFLSGTFFALVLSLLIGLYFFLLFWISRDMLLRDVYLGISLVSLVFLVAILERFKHQRRREVWFLWSATYLLLNGAVKSDKDLSLDDIQAGFRPGQDGGTIAEK
jgi:small-conductance mechanosensitive channel